MMRTVRVRVKWVIVISVLWQWNLALNCLLFVGHWCFLP